MVTFDNKSQFSSKQMKSSVPSKTIRAAITEENEKIRIRRLKSFIQWKSREMNKKEKMWEQFRMKGTFS